MHLTLLQYLLGGQLVLEVWNKALVSHYAVKTTAALGKQKTVRPADPTALPAHIRLSMPREAPKRAVEKPAPVAKDKYGRPLPKPAVGRGRAGRGAVPVSADPKKAGARAPLSAADRDRASRDTLLGLAKISLQPLAVSVQVTSCAVDILDVPTIS